jgi:hypothetical protein
MHQTSVKFRTPCISRIAGLGDDQGLIVEGR